MNWNQPQRGGVTAKPVDNALRGRGRTVAFAAVALLCIAAFVTAYLVWPGGKNSHDGEGAIATRQRATKESSPRSDMMTGAQPHKADAPAKGVAAANATDRPAAASAQSTGAVYERRPGQLRLPDGQILTFPPPAEGETRLVHAYGHTYECDHLGNFRDITPRRLFDTAFEANLFALAQSEGKFIPAFLLGLDEADVKAMLLKGYTSKGDETEDEMRSLRAYDELRCAVLEYMEQGGRFDDFVGGVADFEREQRQARAAGLREVMTLVKQDRVEEAKRMAEEADSLLKEKGFAPIRLPAHVREAFDGIR